MKDMSRNYDVEILISVLVFTTDTQSCHLVQYFREIISEFGCVCYFIRTFSHFKRYNIIFLYLGNVAYSY